MKKVFSIFSSLIVLSGAQLAQAQDHHYWSNQFGDRSAFMGGAVVGGVSDNTASYYNPGGLGFITDPSISVSANAYKIETIQVGNGIGNGDDLDSDQVNVVPLFVGGSHVFESMPGHVFGYSLLTKNQTSTDFSARQEAIGDFTVGPGQDDFVGQFTSKSDLAEIWAGLSWGTKVDDHIGVGVSNFLALRTEDSSENALARSVNRETFIPSIVDASQSTDYWNLRLLWKVGAQFDYSPVKFGIVATTPSVSLTGDGKVARDFTIANVDIDGNGVGLGDGLVADDRQEDLDAEYRTPVSVAAGAEWEITSDTSVGLTAEWFGARSEYSVMVPNEGDFVLPTGVLTGVFNSREFLNVVDSDDDVLNYSLGVEHKFSDEITGYLSARTDFETVREIDTRGVQIGGSIFDIYHITAGAVFHRERSDIGLGVTYSFGDDSGVGTPVDFSHPSESNLLGVGEQLESDVEYDAVSVILSYNYRT